MMTRMTRMTHWLDSHDSLARWLAVCQDPGLSVPQSECDPSVKILEDPSSYTFKTRTLNKLLH